jgi:hypothetical protein
MRPMEGLLVVGIVLGANGSVMHADPNVKEGVQQTPKSKLKDRPIDPKADALLLEMSNQLSSMKSFTFQSSQVMEVVTKDGQKIQGLAETNVSIQRPNRMRVDRMGFKGGGSIYYDGANVTFYGKQDNLYATTVAPDNLDDMVDFTRDQLSIDAPGADLIYSNPYSVLMEDAVSGQYLGAEPVGDRMCHHLAYRGKETDWQIWIEDGGKSLPCRFVITSKKVTGSPQFTVSTTNWKEQSIAPDKFAFAPPKDATKIEFVKVSDDAKQKRQARRK